MALALTLLDEVMLPPAVRKAVGAGAPAQLKQTVARGMAPMPPRDLVVALYQLSLDEDEEVREAARKTRVALPDAVLSVALSSPLDVRVLDMFARASLERPSCLEVLIANPATSDETFAALAALGDEQLVERIARNEQRLLRFPAIITALYLNRRTRTSTAMRSLELAVHAGVVVEGIPSYEDVKAAIQTEGPPTVEADVPFAAALDADPSLAVLAATDGEVDEETIRRLAEEADAAAARDNDDRATAINRLPLAAKLRLAAIGGAFARAQLVRDSNKTVAIAAVKSPSLTEQEAERYAANRALHEEVIRFIGQQRSFTRRYAVKLHLVNNPKCPLALSIVFLGHLTVKDLRQVSRSKSVPSALSKAAHNLIDKRESR